MKGPLQMKLIPVLATIGFAAAMSAQAQALDAHAQAAALLSSANRIETNGPQLAPPSVASSDAIDSQMRAANLLHRPLPSETASSEATTQSQRTTGAAPSAHDLARQLLDRRA